MVVVGVADVLVVLGDAVAVGAGVDPHGVGGARVVAVGVAVDLRPRAAAVRAHADA